MKQSLLFAPTLREIPKEAVISSHQMLLKGGYIKMNASKEIRARYGDVTVWQRGFYDHVIRNREDYDKIINYIDENPVRWNLDELYTEE